MTFLWPAALWLLLAMPLLVGAAVALRRRRARHVVTFTNLEVLEGVVPRRPSAGMLATALFAVGILVLLTALARPQTRVPVQREDATVVLVLDGSASMMTSDVLPTRLDAAKDAARTFVDTMPEGPRIGVVRFSTDASVLAWPTEDRRMVRRSIEALQADGSTAIGDGLMRALRLTPAFRAQANGDEPSERLSAVVLLSDGRNNSGRHKPLQAAATAAELGVPVFTVALGEERPYIGPLGDAVDRETLARMSAVTGAQAFSAPTEEDLQQIYRNMASRLGYEMRYQEATFAFAGVGALLLAAATALGLLRRPALP
jgi:Ca-activated chloride channel homolog